MKNLIADLKQKLTTADTPEAKITILNDLAQAYMANNPQLCIQTGEEAATLAKEHNQTVGYLNALFNQAGAHSRLFNLDRSLALIQQALELARQVGSKYFESRALNNIGALYSFLADYERALEYYFQALKIREIMEDKRFQNETLGNIALIYFEAKDYQKALEYCNRGLKLAQEIEDRPGSSFPMSLMANIYTALGDPDTGLDYHFKSLEIRTEMNDIYAQASIQHNIGDIYAQSQEHDKAARYLHKSLELNRQIQYQRGEVDSLRSLGLMAQQQKDWPSALRYFTQALDLIQDNAIPEKEHVVHEALYHYYKETNELENALYHFELFHQAKEKLFNTQSDQRMKQLAITYELDRNRREAEIAQKEKEIVEREKEVATQEKEFYRLKNVDLANALEEVQELNTQLTQLNDEKNELISIVAHDLQSPLSGLKLVSTLMKTNYTKMPEDDLFQQLETIEHTTDQMLNIVINLLDVKTIESGNLAIQLQPTNIAKLTKRLVQSLYEQAQTKQQQLHFTAKMSTIEAQTDPRILQQVLGNLMSNALKFSPYQSNIYISVQPTATTVQIRIRDEGPGIHPQEQTQLFDKYTRLSARPTANENSTGLGLWIVHKLMQALQGEVWYEDAQPHGAVFVVALPLS